MEETMAMELVEFQTLCRLALGETQLMAGHLEAAQALAEGALAQARAHQERGHQAYALCLLGDIAVRHEPPDSEPAEAHYQHALALAEELCMPPRLARCYHGLGMLYRQTDRATLSRAARSTAVAMYRAMDMSFWLPQAEA